MNSRLSVTQQMTIVVCSLFEISVVSSIIDARNTDCCIQLVISLVTCIAITLRKSFCTSSEMHLPILALPTQALLDLRLPSTGEVERSCYQLHLTSGKVRFVTEGIGQWSCGCARLSQSPCSAMHCRPQNKIASATDFSKALLCSIFPAFCYLRTY